LFDDMLDLRPTTAIAGRATTTTADRPHFLLLTTP
jgi:hypothetical protein